MKYYIYTMTIGRILFLITILVAPGLSSVAQQAQRKGSMRKPFVFSNQFKHAAGAGASFYRIDHADEPLYHIEYSPTLSLTRSYSDFSVSLGANLKGGYHPSTTADTSEFIYAAFPLVFELNFGNNASKDFYNDFGWFFGGGYQYHLFNENWEHGPVATVGLRGFVFGPSLTLRYSRHFAIAETDRSLHQVSLLLNLGRYFKQVKLNNKVSRFK